MVMVICLCTGHRSCLHYLALTTEFHYQCSPHTTVYTLLHIGLGGGSIPVPVVLSPLHTHAWETALHHFRLNFYNNTSTYLSWNPKWNQNKSVRYKLQRRGNTTQGMQSKRKTRFSDNKSRRSVLCLCTLIRKSGVHTRPLPFCSETINNGIYQPTDGAITPWQTVPEISMISTGLFQCLIWLVKSFNEDYIMQVLINNLWDLVFNHLKIRIPKER